jgi:hypothetical protein
MSSVSFHFESEQAFFQRIVGSASVLKEKFVSVSAYFSVFAFAADYVPGVSPLLAWFFFKNTGFTVVQWKCIGQLTAKL